MKSRTRTVLVVGGLAASSAALYGLSRWLNYHPRRVETVDVGDWSGHPLLTPGQVIKALTFNIQFSAGTDYHFFYDGGPDSLVRATDVRQTARRIGEYLSQEQPDLILLQEVDVRSKRTAYLDQIRLLADALPAELRGNVSTYYWRSRFVPHPKIWGPVATKLVVFSRFRVSAARRFQLPSTPLNPLVREFGFRRAFLELELPLTTGRRFFVLNTHLEAFPGTTQVMEWQVSALLKRLQALSDAKVPWLLGGDFNLLPPGQYLSLSPEDCGPHTASAELAMLFDRYSGVPRPRDATGPDQSKVYTYCRPTPSGRKPARTLDYLFSSENVRLQDYAVRQQGTASLSDHFPVAATYRLLES
jgi:endonuclease/exonuclease/phosphatase family metal-dependent hydrolase